MHDAAVSWIAEHRPRLLGGLHDLLRIPSVSTDPAHRGDMDRTAAFLCAHLTRIGLQNVRLLDGGGNPAVYADWTGAPPGAPTFLLYGHYDVQPSDPLELWDSPPFQPETRDGRLYARGTSDNKGPHWVMLCALEALLANGGLPVNIRLLLEGEEEIGSRTLPALLSRHADLLRGHTLISSDGGRWRHDLVSVNSNSRGLTALEFTVKTADADLHSGRFGGPVANPIAVLCRIAATLHDEHGRIAVDGFFDGLRPPTNADRVALDAIPFDEAAFLGEIGAKPGAGERGMPLLEQLWLRPTLELNGIAGGYDGPGVKTVLPSEARAKITCRLGVGQDPARVGEAVERHLRAQCPSYATLTVIREPGAARAYALPDDNTALLAFERVTERLHGRKPLHVGVGGTLPISSLVKEALGMETVMVSCAVADSNIHAPNEFLRISSFDEGLREWLALLPELAHV